MVQHVHRLPDTICAIYVKHSSLDPKLSGDPPPIPIRMFRVTPCPAVPPQVCPEAERLFP